MNKSDDHAERDRDITMADKRQVFAEAKYMVARLRGKVAVPPMHWTTERIEMYERILADPDARRALLSWTLEGAARLTPADRAEIAQLASDWAAKHPDEK